MVLCGGGNRRIMMPKQKRALKKVSRKASGLLRSKKSRAKDVALRGKSFKESMKMVLREDAELLQKLAKK